MKFTPYTYSSPAPDECQVCGKKRHDNGRQHDCLLRATYMGWERHWRGVIKHAVTGETVAICLPLCRNRDQSSRTNGRSAMSFSADLLSRMQMGSLGGVK